MSNCHPKLGHSMVDSLDDAKDVTGDPKNLPDQRKPKRQSAGPQKEKNVSKKPRASMDVGNASAGPVTPQSTASVAPPSLDVVQRLMKLPPAKRYSAAKLFDSIMDELEPEKSTGGESTRDVNLKAPKPNKARPMKNPSVVKRTGGKRLISNVGAKTASGAASKHSAASATGDDAENPKNVVKKPSDPKEKQAPSTPPPSQTVFDRGYELKKSRVFFENGVPKLYWECTISTCFGMSVSEIDAKELIPFHAHNHNPRESPEVEVRRVEDKLSK